MTSIWYCCSSIDEADYFEEDGRREFKSETEIRTTIRESILAERIKQRNIFKEEAIKALETAATERDATITELQDTLAKDKEDMKEKMEELNKMKKKEALMKKKAALLEIGFDEEEAEESLASYENLDDATFEIREGKKVYFLK